jgi:hypothetical protein
MDLRGGNRNSILRIDPDFSLLRSVHTGCGVCPVSYSLTLMSVNLTTHLNAWSFTSTIAHFLMARGIIKQTDNTYF